MTARLMIVLFLLPVFGFAQTEQPAKTPLDAAIQLYKDGSFDEAFAKFKELHDARPNDAALGYWLAVTQVAQANAEFGRLAGGKDGAYAGLGKTWQWWIGEAFRDATWLAGRTPGPDTKVPVGPQSPEELLKLVANTKWVSPTNWIALSPDRAYLACRNPGTRQPLHVVDVRSSREVALHVIPFGDDGYYAPLALFFCRSPEPIAASMNIGSHTNQVRIECFYVPSGDETGHAECASGRWDQGGVHFDSKCPGGVRANRAHAAFPVPGGDRFFLEAPDRFYLFRPDPHGVGELLQASMDTLCALPAKDFGPPVLLPPGWQRGTPLRCSPRGLFSQDGTKVLLDVEQPVADVGTAAAWAVYDIAAEPRFLGLCPDWLSEQRLDVVRQRYLLVGPRKYPKLPMYARGDVIVTFGPDYVELSTLEGVLLQRLRLSLLGEGFPPTDE